MTTTDVTVENLERRLDGQHDVPYVADDAWRIRNDSDAEYAARQAARAQARLDTIDAWVQDAIERVHAAAEAERKEPANTLQFFEAALGQYLDALIRSGRKRKTLTLPHGSIAIRKRPALVDVDPAAFLPWARENRPDLVRVKEEPDKAKIKKVAQQPQADFTVTVDDNGEVMPGVSIIEQGETSAFTAAKPADHGKEDTP